MQCFAGGVVAPPIGASRAPGIPATALAGGPRRSVPPLPLAAALAPASGGYPLQPQATLGSARAAGQLSPGCGHATGRTAVPVTGPAVQRYASDPSIRAAGVSSPPAGGARASARILPPAPVASPRTAGVSRLVAVPPASRALQSLAAPTQSPSSSVRGALSPPAACRALSPRTGSCGSAFRTGSTPGPGVHSPPAFAAAQLPQQRQQRTSAVYTLQSEGGAAASSSRGDVSASELLPRGQPTARREAFSGQQDSRRPNTAGVVAAVAAAAAAAAAVPGGPASAASRTSPGREERRASPRGRGASPSPPRSGSPAAAAAVASPPAAASAASRQAASSSRGGSSPPGPGGSLRPSGSSPPALSPRTAARTSRNTATAAAAPAASSSSSAPSRRSAEGNRGVAAVTAAVVPALPLWTPRRDEAARLLGTRNEGSPDRLGALSLDEVLSQVEGFDHAMRQKAAYARRVTGRLAGQRKAAEARNRVLQAGCSKRIASPSSPRLSGHGAISAKVRGRGSANGLAVASAPGDPAHESDRHNALQVPAIALETLPLALASSDADKAPRVEALTSAVAKTIADVRRLVQERSKTAIAAADAAAKRTSDVEVSIEEAIVPGPDQAEEEARSATDRGPLWLGLAGDDDDELSESDEEEGTFATASPAGSASAVRLEPSFRRAA